MYDGMDVDAAKLWTAPGLEKSEMGRRDGQVLIYCGLRTEQFGAVTKHS